MIETAVYNSERNPMKACASIAICIAIVVSLKANVNFQIPSGFIGSVLTLIVWVMQTAVIYMICWLPLYSAAKGSRFIFKKWTGHTASDPA